MLGNIYTDTARNSWNNVPGQDIALEYNKNNKVTKITYIKDNATVFVQNFTYDSNSNCILITCTES